jgi:hypothetical protein
VFDRLGVFTGTFDAVAARAVASDNEIDHWQVLDAVANLVAKSMLSTEDGTDGSSRYSVPETLRQFARERLDDSRVADHWRRKHAMHYATFTRDVGFGLTGPDEFMWVKRLQADLDNVRAAVTWALDNDDADVREVGVTIVAGLTSIGQLTSDLGIPASAAQAAEHAKSLRPELRAPVLASAAYHWWNQGHPDEAKKLARAALRDGVIQGSPHPLAAHTSLMAIEISVGNAQAAIEVGNAARPVLETIDSPYAEGLILSGLAIWEAMVGQWEQSSADAARSLEVARRLQNPTCLVQALHAIAWAHQRDDPAGALSAADQSIHIYRQSPRILGAAVAVLALAGGLRSRLGDPSGALELVHESLVLAREQGARPQLASTLDWALSPLIKVGRAEAAATLVGALTRGSLAGVGEFPGVASARTKILQRLQAIIGEETTHALVARGAAMSYDETVEYALTELRIDSQLRQRH